MDGLTHKNIVDEVCSMELFCGNDDTFKVGEWRRWRNACIESGKDLDPNDFKETHCKSDAVVI